MSIAMGSHPLNLMLRFLLELAVLVASGIWGWNQFDGWLRFVVAIGIPIVLAAIWGVFAVPNDPSRSGKAPVPVPGWFRLIIEMLFFCFGTYVLYDLGWKTSGLIMGGLVILHYVCSFDRLEWLLYDNS